MTPTVTTISPAVGFTAGGSLIEIAGTDFRLPTPAPSSGSGPVPVPPPSVRVTFGGVEARRVGVVSSTRLLVLIPEHDQGVFDVVVENLDDFGAQIGVATVVEGFTFSRPIFVSEEEPRPTKVTRALIRAFKRWITPNVVYTQHVDYSDDPLSEISREAEVQLPFLLLAGPTFRKSIGIYRRNVEPTTSDDAGVLTESRNPDTRDLVFGLTLAIDSATSLLSMVNATLAAVNRNHSIYVDIGESEPTKFEIRIEGDPDMQSRATKSSVFSATMTVAVLAVDILEIPGIESDAQTAIRPVVDDVSIGSEAVST